jgi:hypothetical protein
MPTFCLFGPWGVLLRAHRRNGTSARGRWDWDDLHAGFTATQSPGYYEPACEWQRAVCRLHDQQVAGLPGYRYERRSDVSRPKIRAFCESEYFASLRFGGGRQCGL